MIQTSFLQKIKTLLLYTLLAGQAACLQAQANHSPRNLISPMGAQSDSTITLLWDKPEPYTNVTGYQVYCNGKLAGLSGKTNFMLKGVKPNTIYAVHVKAAYAQGEISGSSNTIQVATRKTSKVFNVLDFGAKGDGATMNSKAIQKTIDNCSPGGTVYIPAGVFLSGALFLKSDMTLYIAAGGTLKGSSDVKDYYPLIPTRFEGWEVMSFASLITAGKLDKLGPYNCSNLDIRGEGTISGGGSTLGKAMIAAEGMRARGRLICLMNCQNVNIQGLKITESPCWTIHYTYSKNVVCNGLDINTTAHNGDGINPDSSDDSYIINCTFSTGDDCIAIKSGKNPEGNIIARPCTNIRVTDCNFIAGHSLAIGSELSGGVKNVFIQDCKIGALDEGLRIKTNKFRGGYVENVVVKDCELLKILITTQYTPNNDGEPSKDLSVIKNLEFHNLNMEHAPVSKPVISIDGFDNPENYFKGIIFKNVILPEHAKISLKYCSDVLFEDVRTVGGQKPVYLMDKVISVRN